MAVTETRSKSAGGWTYEDLLQLPDDGKRYELVDGELYEMTVPNLKHQLLSIQLITLLLPHVTQGSGWILHTHTRVFLPGGRMVQPDLIVLLPGGKWSFIERGVEGAPDLVIEILSPSNPERDRIDKRRWYAEAGIREYWIVSPEAAIIEVLTLSDGAYVTHVRAGGDESVTSSVLTGLSFHASQAFAVATA